MTKNEILNSNSIFKKKNTRTSKKEKPTEDEIIFKTRPSIKRMYYDEMKEALTHALNGIPKKSYFSDKYIIYTAEMKYTVTCVGRPEKK